MSAARLVTNARGTMSTTAPMRSSQGARLKSSHHSTINTAPPTTAPIPTSIGSSTSTDASATTVIWMPMIASAGQRRSGFRSTSSFDCIVSLFLVGASRIHDAADRAHQLRPAILLAQELRLAGGGEAVVLRALIGLADAPFRLQP